VSGVSADLRNVQAAADAGSERARLAINIFVHRLVAAVGGMAAVLGGLDALIFTGGIGEHSAAIRGAVTARLRHLGVALDADANERVRGDADVAVSESRARVLVIVAREDLSVLAEVRRVLGRTT
jgi:acetate kinase